MVDRGADAPAPSIHRVEAHGGLHVAVRVWEARREAHPPVVLVHGFMGSVAAWGDLPARLARDRRVVVPDLPGHGDSGRSLDPTAFTVPRMAGALARACADVAPGAADWVGYSMGGRIVLAGVLDGAIQPRRVVLESASPGLAREDERRARRALDEERASALEREGIETFVDGWTAQPLFASQARLPEAVRERERSRRLVHDAGVLAAVLRGAGTGVQDSCWERLPDVAAPCLVLTGELDPRYHRLGRLMADRMPRARHVSVPGAGHAVHLEAPDAWLEAVTGALESDG